MSYKLTEAHVQFAKQYITENSTSFLKELTTVMRNKFDDFDVTEQWLGKVLKANEITRKHVRKYHSPYHRYGKVVDRSQLKSRFYDKVKEYPLNHIICLDETAVQLFMHRNYARCNIGERCSITTTSNTVFKSYTLLVAICRLWDATQVQHQSYMRDEKIKTFQELSDTIKKVIDTKIPAKSLENYFKFAYGEKPKQVVKEVKKHPTYKKSI
jgi:hypothetical protein